MTVFNAWYYSFSPSIADYERQTPLLQQFIKVLIYPLLGILSFSEKAYEYIPGEYGAVTAGMVVSALIGITYLSPLVLAVRPLRHLTLSTKYAILIMSIVIVGLILALASGNTIYIMITSSLLVLVTISISALCFTKSILICKNTIRKGF